MENVFSLELMMEPIILTGFLYLPGAFTFMVIMRFEALNEFLSAPIDAGKAYRGKRIFGDNKTWRGPVAFLLGGFIGLFLLRWLIRYYDLDFPYLKILISQNFLFLAIVLSIAREGGELVNSFVKRQAGVKPGAQGSIIQYIIDQIDMFLMSVIFLHLLVESVPGFFILWGCMLLVIFHSLYTFLVKLFKINPNSRRRRLKKKSKI